jgi:hypothetical protein
MGAALVANWRISRRMSRTADARRQEEGGGVGEVSETVCGIRQLGIGSLVVDVDEWIDGRTSREGTQAITALSSREGTQSVDTSSGSINGSTNGSMCMDIRKRLLGAGEAVVLGELLKRAHKSVTMLDLQVLLVYIIWRAHKSVTMLDLQVLLTDCTIDGLY